MLDFTY